MGPGILGVGPAFFQLEGLSEDVSGRQEQHSYHDVSMHEVRAPGVVRAKGLVAVYAAGRDMCETYS
jgi:hypothetical protein